DPSLRIIPVLLDGITFVELDATERFRDLELRETQCIFEQDVATILSKISDGLPNLRPQSETSLSKLAGQIRAELSDFTGYQVEATLADCGVNLGGWSLAEDLHRQLALSLLALDIERLPRVLGRLVNFEPDERPRIRKIADLLVSNWVEIEAVRGIV